MTDETDSDPPQITSRYPRLNGILITPGEGSTASQPLEKIILKTFNKDVGIKRLETLQWLTNDLLTGIFPMSSTPLSVEDARKRRVQDVETLRRQHHTLDSFDDEPTSAPPVEVTPGEPDQVRGALREATNDVVPDEYGIADCALDLGPLEQAIRPAYRLAVLGGSDYSPLKGRRPHPVDDLITTLADADVAFLLQTIVQQCGTNSYTLSQRLLPYPPDYGLATEHDFGAVVADGPKYSLSDHYNDGGYDRFTDTRSFDVTEFFTVSQRSDGSYAVTERTKHGETAANRARLLLRGHSECRDLYGCFHDNLTDFERLYRDRDYYTKIPVDASDLGGFMSLPPCSTPHSSFDGVGYVDEPEVHKSPVQIPTGVLDEETPQYQTQGGKTHRGREQRAKSWLEDAGWTVRVRDAETPGSVPDLEISKDEIVKNVEIEDGNLSQPANIVKNAIRALHQDRDVIFIVGSKSEAQRVASLLAHPVRETTPNGARLFTQSTKLTLEDGGTPLLPADDSTGASRWETTWNGRHELLSNGDVIASGPVDGPVSSYDYATDVVEGPPPADRTAVHPPMHPPKLCLLNHVELRYEVDTHTFAKLDKDKYGNDWNVSNDEGARKRYSGAMEACVEQKLVSVPRSLLRDGRDGTSLAPAEVSKRDFFDFFRDEFYAPQCSRKAPGNGECGRAMPTPPGSDESYFKEWNDNDRGISYDFLAEHTFAWQTGIMSSDLPFVAETYRRD